MSSKVCAVPGCGRPLRSAIYCGMHYSRFVRTGTTDPRPRRPDVIACEIDGCVNPVRLNGGRICAMHRARIARHGSPSVVSRGPNFDWVSAFWEKVDKEGPAPVVPSRPLGGSCWVYRGALSSEGYGRIRDAEYAHRAAYQLLVGPIPEGLELDHVCRNRQCVKVVADSSGPAHIEAVTHSENMRRSVPFRRPSGGQRAAS